MDREASDRIVGAGDVIGGANGLNYRAGVWVQQVQVAGGAGRGSGVERGGVGVGSEAE